MNDKWMKEFVFFGMIVVPVYMFTALLDAHDEDTAVTYERHGIIERRATIVSRAAGYRLVDEGGAALVEAEYTVDGTVTVLDRDCQVVQRWTSDQP